MLYPTLRSCTDCASVDTLLAEIECKLATMSSTMYTNLVFMLNKPVNKWTLFSLLMYRNILLYKDADATYLSDYTVEMVASKVKLLKYK